MREEKYNDDENVMIIPVVLWVNPPVLHYLKYLMISAQGIRARLGSRISL